MIIYRSYGKTIEVTETQKDICSNRKVFCSREKRLFVTARRSDSVRRTKQICVRKLLSATKELGAPLFITLTFNGPASDILLSAKRLTYFFRRLRISFPNSHALFVPELSPEGRIHYHGLLFGVSQEWGSIYIGKGKRRKCVFVGRERKERKFAELWGYGFVDVVQSDGSPRVVSYITKYITQSTNDPFFAPIRLVRTSKNFPKHFECRGSIAQELKDYIKVSPRFTGVFYSPFLGNITKTYYDE